MSKNNTAWRATRRPAGNKVSIKVKKQGMLNMQMNFESMLMLPFQKVNKVVCVYLKLVCGCRKYSLSKLARFFETQCRCNFTAHTTASKRFPVFSQKLYSSSS